MYQILRRLERAGWMISEWECVDPSVDNRPARRYYQLTEEGERVAEELVRETRSRVRGLGRARPEWGKA
jgi:DNA-binding PadR family transcriptional regulator